MATTVSKQTPSSAAGDTVIGRYRWKICAVLFLATTINYTDRQVLGVLAPDLQKSIGWNELEYGYLVTAFQAAYAVGLLSSGAIIDRIGTRMGYALAMIIWGIAAAGHALASSVMGFAAARFLLGLGEAGNFPAAIKTVAEWFPRKERSFATGIFNSGTNVGAILAPLMVPPLAIHYGWQSAFLVTGALVAVPLVVWLMTYHPPEVHPRLSTAELQYIQSDQEPVSQKIPWATLLKHRQTWAFVAGKFLTDPIWWFFLFWLPKFLNTSYGLTLTGLGIPLVVIYLVSDFGSIGGGWMGSRFMKLGWTSNRARKTAMLVSAVSVVPIVLAAQSQTLWAAIALISLATAAHQSWSANLFSTVGDMFPRHAVASVVGIGGFAGAIGGMLIATFTGWLLEVTHSYVPVFFMAGSAYLLALGVFHILVPKLEAAKFE